MLKKVLFSDDKNTQHNICCSWIKIDLRCNFIVMILTRTGLHRQHTSFNIFTFQKWIEKCLELHIYYYMYFIQHAGSVVSGNKLIVSTPLMAQSIPSVRTLPGICHLVAPGGGNLSENLCLAVRHLSNSSRSG